MSVPVPVTVTATLTPAGCVFAYTPTPSISERFTKIKKFAGANLTGISDSVSGSTHSISLTTSPPNSLVAGQRFTCTLGFQNTSWDFQVGVAS